MDVIEYVVGALCVKMGFGKMFCWQHTTLTASSVHCEKVRRYAVPGILEEQSAEYVDSYKSSVRQDIKT